VNKSGFDGRALEDIFTSLAGFHWQFKFAAGATQKLHTGGSKMSHLPGVAPLELH